MTTKLVEPVLRYLLDAGDVNLMGSCFLVMYQLCLGEDSYQYLVDEYHISGVITGFETAELLYGIYKCIDLL